MYRIYALLAVNVSYTPKSFVFDTDTRFSGKKLLWEVDDMISEKMGYPVNKPIRFNQIKETSFGMVGIGPIDSWTYAVLAASYGPIDYLRSDYFESLNKRPGLDPLEGFLEYWYKDIN